MRKLKGGLTFFITTCPAPHGYQSDIESTHRTRPPQIHYGLNPLLASTDFLYLVMSWFVGKRPYADVPKEWLQRCEYRAVGLHNPHANVWLIPSLIMSEV